MLVISCGIFTDLKNVSAFNAGLDNKPAYSIITLGEWEKFRSEVVPESIRSWREALV